MVDYQIQIEIDGVSYYLDTYPELIDVSFTYDIADIKSLTGRNSSYSYPIKVPDSDKNRQIFGFIADLARDLDFDPRKQLRGYYFRNSILVFDGFIKYRELTINKKTGEREYDLIFYGDNDTIYNKLNGAYLEDMDFSEYDHVFDKQTMINSWTASNGASYRYGLIDYGFNWTIDDVNGNNGATSSYVEISEMFPSISKKLIFDRMMQNAGLSYISYELNTDDFKNEYIPLSVAQMPGQDSVGRLFKASNYGITQSIIAGANGTYSPPYRVYETLIAQDFEDPNDLWNSTDSYYENNDVFSLSERFSVLMQFKRNTNQTFFSFINVYSNMNPDGSLNPLWNDGGGYLVNGDDNDDDYIFDDEGVLFISYIASGSSAGTYLNNTIQNNDGTFTMFYQTDYIVLRPGEKIRFVVNTDESSSNGTNIFDILKVNISNEMNPIGVPGTLISMNKIVPKKIKQLDFFASIVAEKNLFIERSKNQPNTFIIEPRDRYYNNGEIVDWSKKLDEEKEIKEKAISDDKDRFIILTHKEDKDWYNKDYKQEIGEIYGQHNYDTLNEHTQSTKKIETIFSPTPLVNVSGAVNFPIPSITKDVITGYNQLGTGRIESNIRSLYWGGMIDFDNEFDKFCFEGTTYSAWPYIGHLSNPYSSTQSIDLNFGQLKNAYFNNDGITDQNLFRRYWEKTLLELTGQESKLVTCYLKLTPIDIYNLKFNHKIWMEIGGNGQYYRLNKIYQWNPNTLDSCKVELILAKDISIAPKKPSSKKPSKQVRPDTPIRTSVGLISPTIEVIKNTPKDTNRINPGAGGVLIVSDEGGNRVGDSSGVVVNGDGIDIGNINRYVFVNGITHSLHNGVSKSIISGDGVIVGSFSQNIYSYGDSIIVGSASQNIYNWGNYNTFADGVTSSYVFGNYVYVTQSNTTYFNTDVKFLGPVDGLNLGLQQVLDYNNEAGLIFMTMSNYNFLVGDNDLFVGPNDFHNYLNGSGNGATAFSAYNKGMGQNVKFNGSTHNDMLGVNSNVFTTFYSDILGEDINIFNTLYGEFKGKTITATNSSYLDIHGQNISLTASTWTYVNGQNIGASSSSYSNLNGSSIVYLNSAYCNVSGLILRLTGCSAVNVSGRSINATSSFANIAGQNITAISNGSGIFGYTQSVFADRVLVAGGNHIVRGPDSGAIGNGHYIGTASSGCLLAGRTHTVDKNLQNTAVLGGTSINATQSNALYSPRQLYSRTSDAPTLIASVGWTGGLTASSMSGYVEITTDLTGLTGGTLFILAWASIGKHYTSFTPANDNAAGLTYWAEFDNTGQLTSLKYSGTLIASTTYKFHYTNNPLI